MPKTEGFGVKIGDFLYHHLRNQVQTTQVSKIGRKYIHVANGQKLEQTAPNIFSDGYCSYVTEIIWRKRQLESEISKHLTSIESKIRKRNVPNNILSEVLEQIEKIAVLFPEDI